MRMKIQIGKSGREKPINPAGWEKAAAIRVTCSSPALKRLVRYSGQFEARAASIRIPNTPPHFHLL